MKAGIILVLIMIAGCAGPQSENGAEEVEEWEGKDQPLVIQLAVNGCVEEVLPPEDDNCRGPGETIRFGCGDLKDCACAARGKTVSWQVALPPSTTSTSKVPAMSPAFEILFTAEQSPFQRGCVLQAAAGREVRCRVDREASGDYEYQIKVASCMEEYDPRIVIRNF